MYHIPESSNKDSSDELPLVASYLLTEIFSCAAFSDVSIRSNLLPSATFLDPNEGMKMKGLWSAGILSIELRGYRAVKRKGLWATIRNVNMTLVIPRAAFVKQPNEPSFTALPTLESTELIWEAWGPRRSRGFIFASAEPPLIGGFRMLAEDTVLDFHDGRVRHNGDGQKKGHNFLINARSGRQDPDRGTLRAEVGNPVIVLEPSGDSSYRCLPEDVGCSLPYRKTRLAEIPSWRMSKWMSDDLIASLEVSSQQQR